MFSGKKNAFRKEALCFPARSKSPWGSQPSWDEVEPNQKNQYPRQDGTMDLAKKILNELAISNPQRKFDSFVTTPSFGRRLF